MYLTAVKLARILFWAAVAAAILALLIPEVVPVWLPMSLAGALGSLVLYAVLHVRRTRRWGLRCPSCNWVPFGLEAWKCKECGFVWDTFATEGVCPRCEHEHAEAACVRCRQTAPFRRWAAAG